MLNPLRGYWSGSGLNLGDTVLVHSSMKRVFRFLISQGIKADPELVVDSLIHEVGPDGTILFPLFNFDFPKTKNFSILKTPSQMGVITEFARRNYEGYRTGHPIYSFYVIGEKSKEFKNIDNISGYGIDSPFAKLIELEGKVASVDLDDQNSMTIYHHVEELMQVNYRYVKTFEGIYENESGISFQKAYTLFVRDLEKGVITNVNGMGEILWGEGLYVGNRPGVNNGMRTVDAKKLTNRTSRIISEGRALGILYSIEPLESHQEI